MNKTLLLILFVFLMSSWVEAATFYNFQYEVKDNDSFISIIKQFVKPDSVINASTPMIAKIKKENSIVNDWRNIKPGITLELYISPEFLSLDKYRDYLKRKVAVLNKAEGEIAKENSIYPKGFKSSAFYMASIGNFTQESVELAKVNFHQNSLVSLGLNVSYYPNESLYSTSGSLYYSKLTASSVDNLDTAGTVDVPAELGATLFQEYRYTKLNTTFYAGPDFERFTTFDLEALKNDRKIYLEQSSVVYLTVGLSKQFTLFNRKWFTKFSISKSLVTNTKTEAPSEISSGASANGGQKYDGYKVLLYLNYKFSEKVFLHSLLKYHMMSGPSDISALRIGVGFGYIFF